MILAAKSEPGKWGSVIEGFEELPEAALEGAELPTLPPPQPPRPVTTAATGPTTNNTPRATPPSPEPFSIPVGYFFGAEAIHVGQFPTNNSIGSPEAFFIIIFTKTDTDPNICYS